ncbi:MAG: rhomboid family intramembrane serine protease, partial [Candidatus Nanohalobium sp.]
MGECSKCGKKAMTFTCRYCSEKFCAEHRLPENHDCEGLEEKVEKEKSQAEKQWFQEKESKQDQEQRTVTASTVPSRPSIGESFVRTLKSNYTLALISVTVLTFIMEFTVPGFVNALILDPAAQAVLYRPWTLVTVVFLHGGLFHLFANMVTFYFFGTPVEKAVGGREMLKLYFGSAVAASLGYVAFRNLLYYMYGATVPAKTLLGIHFGSMPTLGAAVGASGAVVAFVGAVAMLYPEAEVLLYFVIPMKIKTAVYAFGGFEAFNLLMKLAGYQLPFVGMFASSAHLTGLAIGLWYGKRLRDKHMKRSAVFNPLGY